MAPVKIRIRRSNPAAKARKWNWDTQETFSLLDVYQSERSDLSNGSSKWKRSLWKRVTNRLYPHDSPYRRTHVEVQKKWRNLCTALRQELSKNARKKTSKAEPSLPPILTKVAEIVASEHVWKRELAESPIPETMPSEKRAINGEVAIDTTSLSSSCSMPSSSSLNVGTVETILPTLPSSSTMTAKKTPVSSANALVPVFIKEEPLSPVPEAVEAPQILKEIEDVSKTKVIVPVAKSSHPVFTFATPPSTNTTSGPTPLRIISIVNPLSSSSQSSTSNTPPKFVLKPLNSFTNLAKPSTSNMVVLGPRAPGPHKKLSTHQPVFLQARKPDEVKIVDSDVLKMEAEKLVVAQERLHIEKEALQIQKEKLDVEKKKLEHAKQLFESEKTCKRTMLEEKKIFLENKKLKSEISKLALEKELLALQVKQLRN